MTDWTKAYGDSYLNYPIEEGECITLSNVNLMCADIVKNKQIVETFIRGIDRNTTFVYCDPPWNQSNISTFYTKAQKKGEHPRIDEFNKTLLELCCQFPVAYIEQGKSVTDVSNIVDYIHTKYPDKICTVYPTTYYKRNPAHLIRICSEDHTIVEDLFSGVDDDYTPGVACEVEHNWANTVVDFCVGRGLTVTTAIQHGYKMYGIELNKYRLSVAIEKATKLV